MKCSPKDWVLKLTTGLLDSRLVCLRWLVRRRGGGWMVEGPLAGSPAEEAGILGGETLTEIGEEQASMSSSILRKK